MAVAWAVVLGETLRVALCLVLDFVLALFVLALVLEAAVLEFALMPPPLALRAGAACISVVAMNAAKMGKRSVFFILSPFFWGFGAFWFEPFLWYASFIVCNFYGATFVVCNFSKLFKAKMA